MKFFLATIGIIGSGILGYVLEPEMRFGLTGQMPVTTPSTPAVVTNPTQPAVPAPVPPVTTTPSYDYSKLQPNQLPEKVIIKSQATATAAGETDAVPLTAGTKVKPLRIEGSDLVFSVLGTAQGKIPVTQTNLIEQLLANPPPAPTPVAPVEPTPPPVVAKEEPAKTPEPMPEPTKETEPTPEPTPTAATLAPDDIVKLMQESVRSAQIKEFTFDQVIGWKAGEDEEVDGEKFQTGLAAYKAETIFGVKNIQAKALIRGGKVIRWIWPTSGLEIQ